MDRLWAPWRIQFIQDLRDQKGGCVFCEMVNQQNNDKENQILYRGKNIFVVMNKYPYNNGHLLVIPYSHKAKLVDLKPQERQEMLTAVSFCTEIIEKELNADGFNCGMNIGKAAGAGIEDHLHLHVVPRWVGDSNFLPVLSDTRSIPEYLQDTYSKLISSFDKLVVNR